MDACETLSFDEAKCGLLIEARDIAVGGGDFPWGSTPDERQEHQNKLQSVQYSVCILANFYRKTTVFKLAGVCQPTADIIE
jgi:hypothetical protein